ncbi:ATP-dependent zinc metalloprotease FtsH [Candidatus Aminicenantes bacterium AC-708-M15]|jgi:cell division protease FtsH|nr:ATP-dependent zinc metalloprotease FtsH [SCandidatus Aminicenantes bacterium Aminicenantia_JdfR_composite]MCP2599198.1 ATP-dependent zinc metalloprotease FtsH [Candidatus Aminicenantes bacterium AC-335-B20]MCP2604138.1 ATP-dependent zinc metalloprotease FtsH [Candidatus Aminicenantes bacterium AC-708-M15]MCP2606265.1 ATP-dependent zinc metalloprotease FtsH [Candidatus Aminicenantes bacterium AC-708-I09]MCP2617955.1 ATP-dependent zinc metalloprotease FtsH [Candidatus Aminicenantes bacterium A
MPKRSRPFKNLFFWIIAGIAIIILWSLLQSPSASRKELKFSEFLDEVENNKIAEVTIAGNEIKGKYKDGTSFKTYSPPQFNDLVNILRKHNVLISARNTSRSPWLSNLFIWLPMVILIVFWILFMKQMQAGGNKALSFGKSRAKLFTDTQKRITFKDVAGVEEAKEELQEIIDFLKNPQKFQRLGGKIPKGVLLVGPPGTGKTLLAKAVAGEANVPFFSISGSDFVEMFVGVGASRVRDLFEQGKKHAPCLIFIDEIDAVGRQRGAGLGGGHDEREQTLNQLLVEMDGFDSNEGIIVIAATNRPDILDRALLRPGRFDRRIVVNMPDAKGREEILKVHTRKIPLAKDVDLKTLARSTPGFSGADLANMVNEAALIAARRGHDKVYMKDFEYAKDKVLMGAERKSLIISEEEKKATAYHEGGHALVAALLPEADPIHKVTIIPRGFALGMTQQLPLDDRYTYSKDYLDAQLTVLLAGRVAEELILKKLTTGAANDFEKATEIARKMVCQWGMSDLGPLTFGETDDLVFLGRDLVMHKNFSEETAKKIDEEVKKIINKNYQRARKLIEENKDKLIKIAEELLEKEVLTSEEINKIISDGKTTGNKVKKKKVKSTKKPKKIKTIQKPEIVQA